MTRYYAPFWEKVRKGGTDECWPWLGYIKPSGHGLTSYKSAPVHAHRKAWILTYGQIVGDDCVNHTCDNPACCNPDHMYLGTRADNMVDYWTNRPPEARIGYGRRFALTDEQIEQLQKRRKEGALLRECAQEFGLHISTIVRYLTESRREKLARLRAARLANGA